MGQFVRHAFDCTSGGTCPTQGDTEARVTALRAEIARAGLQEQVGVNGAGRLARCVQGPMVVVYPQDVRPDGVVPGGAGRA